MPRAGINAARRKKAVNRWVKDNGWLCPGWGREPHHSKDLTADHIIPLAQGGDENGPLRVLCRSCNSKRGADRRERKVLARSPKRVNTPLQTPR